MHVEGGQEPVVGEKQILNSLAGLFSRVSGLLSVFGMPEFVLSCPRS